MVELGGAQREACEGGRGGHERVRRREGRLELVRVGVGVAGLVVRVDGRGREQPVRVSRVVGVRADAQRHLVNYGASLRVGETVAVLKESRGRRGAGRQDGVGVVSGGEGAGVGRVGEQGVCGQALGVCVRGGRSVRGAAVRQVCEGVCVDSRGDEGVRSQRPIVAVPLFVAEVGNVRLHLRERRDELNDEGKI